MNTINYLLSNLFTGWMGLLLYWLPASLCVIGYTGRTFRNYQTDLEERDKAIRWEKRIEEKTQAGEDVSKLKLHQPYYSPTDTIGTLLGRAIVSITPVANMWAAMFDVAPKMFCKVIRWVEKVFDTPLVPKI